MLKSLYHCLSLHLVVCYLLFIVFIRIAVALPSPWMLGALALRLEDTLVSTQSRRQLKIVSKAPQSCKSINLPFELAYTASSRQNRAQIQQESYLQF